MSFPTDNIDERSVDVERKNHVDRPGPSFDGTLNILKGTCDFLDVGMRSDSAFLRRCLT
jgi:hypothetical protein